MDFRFEGATPEYKSKIQSVLSGYPSWFQKAARISKIVVSNDPKIREQIAMFEHGSRILLVSPINNGQLLTKAIGHEMAHACDDNFGLPHFFSSTSEWILIHKNQMYFDIQKYEREPLEYFADSFVKLLLLGPQRMATTQGKEVQFLTTWVIPTLQGK